MTNVEVPAYNDGTLKHGQRYRCGCIVGVYDCCDELLCCGAHPRNQEKIRAHRREIMFGPMAQSQGLDLDAFGARYGGDVRAPDCCFCHISAPCEYCITHCPDCKEHVDDCECGTCAKEVDRE